jgi:hypothetical protein
LSITSTSADEIGEFSLISSYELITKRVALVALGVGVMPNGDAIG